MYIMSFCNHKHVYNILNRIKNVYYIHCFEVWERLPALEEFTSKQNDVFTRLTFKQIQNLTQTLTRLPALPEPRDSGCKPQSLQSKSCRF